MGEDIVCPAEYLQGMAAVAAKATGGRKHFRYRSEGSMTGSEGGGGSSAKSLSSWSGSTESGSSAECPEPAVGVHVRTAWQIETVQHLFALANLEWTPYHAHYCGMTGVISRFDDDDSHRSACLLRFYNNASVGLGNELPWPLSACEPIPLPSLAAPRPKSHDPYPTLTSPPPTWQSHTGSVPAHLPAPSWAPSRFPPPHPPTSHNASLCPSFSVPSTPSTETARSDTSGNEVCLSAYVAALVVACATARDDMRPDMPKNAPPKPEVCLGCSSLHTLKATKGVCCSVLFLLSIRIHTPPHSNGEGTVCRAFVSSAVPAKHSICKGETRASCLLTRERRPWPCLQGSGKKDSSTRGCSQGAPHLPFPTTAQLLYPRTLTNIIYMNNINSEHCCEKKYKKNTATQRESCTDAAGKRPPRSTCPHPTNCILCTRPPHASNVRKAKPPPKKT